MARGIKTGGRRPGSLNKTTKSVKGALLLAYKKIGGDKAFAAWARANPNLFYPLVTKLLPAELAISAEVGIHHDPLNTFEVARRIAFVLAAAGQRVEDLPAKQVEALPPLLEIPPAEPEPSDFAMVESEPFGIPGPSAESPAELTISTIAGSAAEQGGFPPLRTRLVPRRVIRRRR